jgi:long-chain acyl-CoA synthetase
MSIKRHVITTDFAEVIARMYSDAPETQGISLL